MPEGEDVLSPTRAGLPPWLTGQGEQGWEDHREARLIHWYYLLGQSVGQKWKVLIFLGCGLKPQVRLEARKACHMSTLALASENHGLESQLCLSSCFTLNQDSCLVCKRGFCMN